MARNKSLTAPKTKPAAKAKTRTSASPSKKTNSPISRQVPAKRSKVVSLKQKRAVDSGASKGLGLFELSAEATPSDPAFAVFTPTLKTAPIPLAKLKTLAALIEFWKLKKSKDFSHWGLLPPDLKRRANLSGEDLRAMILENPGYDLYYCSAHPEVEAVYHNAWRAPQVTHTNFVNLSRQFLIAAGIGDAPVDSLSHSSLFATGHLIVASNSVWDRYLPFLIEVFEKAYRTLDSEAKESLYNEPMTPDKITNIELIAARLLGIFLLLKGSDFKSYKIPLLNQEKVLNVHLKFLREMKDYAIEHRSRWHLTAWINYRGLYLAHVMGKSWIIKHIEEISPKAVKIAFPAGEVTYPYPRALGGSVASSASPR